MADGWDGFVIDPVVAAIAVILFLLLLLLILLCCCCFCLAICAKRTKWVAVSGVIVSTIIDDLTIKIYIYDVFYNHYHGAAI